MGIPVYWSLPSTCCPPPLLKPSLKRTRPLPSSIRRRQPIPREQFRLYSDIVRLNPQLRQPTLSPSLIESSEDDEEDCPRPPPNTVLPFSYPGRARFLVSPEEVERGMGSVPPLHSLPRVSARPEADGNRQIVVRQFPPDLPRPDGRASIRPPTEYTDGIPTPSTEDAGGPRDDVNVVPRDEEAVTPPPDTQTEREWGSPSWHESQWIEPMFPDDLTEEDLGLGDGLGADPWVSRATLEGSIASLDDISHSRRREYI